MARQIHNLARPTRAELERFLLELANLQDDLQSLSRFYKSFAGLLPALDSSWLPIALNNLRLGPKKLSQPREAAEVLAGGLINIFDIFTKTPQALRDLEESRATGKLVIRRLPPINVETWILILKRAICVLWREPDLRQKEWNAFAIRYYVYTFQRRPGSRKDALAIFSPLRLLNIPPPTPFEQALVYLVRSDDKTRYCANPECPAPYFFAKRKNQKYCSEICAGPAQRELKRRWWTEHGKEWRMARQGKMPGKRKMGEGRSEKTSNGQAREKGKGYGSKIKK